MNLKEGCVVICDGQCGILTEIRKFYHKGSVSSERYSGYWFNGEKFNDYQGVLFEAENVDEWYKDMWRASIREQDTGD